MMLRFTGVQVDDNNEVQTEDIWVSRDAIAVVKAGVVGFEWPCVEIHLVCGSFIRVEGELKHIVTRIKRWV